MTGRMYPAVAGLSHAAVVVTDLERAERFYVDLLGLEVLARHQDAAGRPRSIWVRLEGEAFLAIERGAPEAARRVDAGAGHHCLALRVAARDRDAWRERLAQAAIEIERSSDYTLYFRDPDGTLVALSHWPEPVRRDAAV